MSEALDTDTPPSTRRIAPAVVTIVAVVAAGLLWLLINAPTGETPNADSALIGRPAPSVVTTTMAGEPFDLSRRKGSWVMLNFFQSSCVPCVEEHPQLVEFNAQQQALDGDGVEFYSVIWNDPREDVEAFFADNGGGWPVLHDDDASIAVAFGVAKVPETWLVNPNGFVVRRLIGATTAEQLSAMVDIERQRYLGGQ